MIKAARYKLQGEGSGQAKYLAFYEYRDNKAIQDFQQSKEFADAMAEMQETWKGRMFDMKWVADYEPIKTWEK